MKIPVILLTFIGYCSLLFGNQSTLKNTSVPHIDPSLLKANPASDSTFLDHLIRINPRPFDEGKDYLFYHAGSIYSPKDYQERMKASTEISPALLHALIRAQNSYLPLDNKSFRRYYSSTSDYITAIYFNHTRLTHNEALSSDSLKDIIHPLEKDTKTTIEGNEIIIKNDLPKDRTYFEYSPLHYPYDAYFSIIIPGNEIWELQKCLFVKGNKLLSSELKLNQSYDQMETKLKNELINTTDRSKFIEIAESLKKIYQVKNKHHLILQSLHFYEKEIPDSLAQSLIKIMEKFKKTYPAPDTILSLEGTNSEAPSIFNTLFDNLDIYQVKEITHAPSESPVCFLYGLKGKLFGTMPAVFLNYNTKTTPSDIYNLFYHCLLYTQAKPHSDEEKKQLKFINLEIKILQKALNE